MNRYIKIISWNIKGCGNPVKRRKVLTYLKSKNTDIAFIQESHIVGEEEAKKFKRDWVATVFHSSYSSKQNGVLILINKKLSFVMLKKYNDKEECIICLEALINGVRTILRNLCIPNKEEPDFFHGINKIIGDREGQVILAGDFISKSLADAIEGCEIGTIAISDHATVELQIDLNTDKTKRGRWRLNTMLLQNKMFSEELTKDLKFFFEINMGSTDKVATVWEASKAYIRGKIIAYATKVKKKVI